MNSETTTKAVDYTTIHVSSAAFENNGLIPSKYTCDGLNINPPLDLDHIPGDAKCLVLIVDDPDAPAKTWVHWIAWNIPVTSHLKENTISGVEGYNDFKKHHYGGPCPPAGLHRYFFKVYALTSLLDLPDSADKFALEKAMSGYITGFGEMIGLYQRS